MFAALFSLCALACGQSHSPASITPMLAPQVSGALEVPGLSAPVRVLRDRWGVPHIYAQSQTDLFVAQGFVQAQDRLFQMDLWRRSVQGRLAEVLGANFLERDAMTRRIQYRGDMNAEWASYGSDAKAIAEAFVRGVNAWVERARAQLPEAFVLAGWTPDRWSADDLLNRTDAFVMSGDALAEVARKQMNDVVADAIRRAGAPPFFSVLAAPVRLPPSRVASAADLELVPPQAFAPLGSSYVESPPGRLEIGEASRRFDHPALRYLVHLSAPGWNVAGATAPWRPGVAIGHNDRLAWGLTPVEIDAQDLEEIPLGAATRTVADSVIVKGRAEPSPLDIELTPGGVVIASDRARGRAIVLRWTGFEPGAAPELAALALDRARNAEEFRAAAARWKVPAARFLYITDEGRAGQVGRVGQVGQVGRVGQVRQVGQAGQVGLAGSRRAVFAHALGITDRARKRFNVGPLDRPDSRDQLFRAVFDPRSWDESRAIVAPGQSEWPDSPHFADLAAVWSAGDMVPLLFSEDAVRQHVDATLTLVPARESGFQK